MTRFEAKESYKHKMAKQVLKEWLNCPYVLIASFAAIKTPGRFLE